MPDSRSGSGPSACVSSADVSQWQQSLQAGHVDECARAAQRLAARCPDDGKAWQLLGLSHLLKGDGAGALTHLERAARLRPRDATVWDSLGMARQRNGDFRRAAEAFLLATRLSPGAAGIWSNAAANAVEAGQAAEGLRLAAHALELAPQLPEAWLNRGNALSALGRSDEALAAFRQALALRPQFGQASLSLGQEFAARGDYREACELTQQALAHEPGFAAAHVNLGSFLNMLGDAGTALAHFRKAVELNPNLAIARSGMLHCLSHTEGAAPEAVFAEHRAFGEWLEAPWRSRWGGHANERDPDKRLRVGFVSGDLRDHPVARFIEPIWRGLNRSHVAIVAYTCQPRCDAVTEKLRDLADDWVEASAMSDHALDARIREDRIDILFDLSGHTAHNRLPVFARKPAPIQASWIGYPGTTGLTAIDYRPVIQAAVPPGQIDHLFTEKLVYLPTGYLFRPPAEAPPVNPLPALARGYVTFGSFNRLSKVSDRVLAAWSRVLQAVPGSRLLVGAVPDEDEQRRLADTFAGWGIDTERIEFHPRVALGRYLALHHDVDILLDTWPYSGGTTTHLGLWMGVPTLTQAGDKLSQRQGAGILMCAGLGDWVVHSEDAFVAQAVRGAGDVAALAALRAGMRQQLVARSLGEGLEGWLDRALRTMWRRWCAGEPPQSFEVGP